MNDIVKGETDTVDFKREFNPSSNQGWLEIIKDIVAMGNTKGGKIIVGLDDDGNPSNFDGSTLSKLDVTNFVDKIFKYTGVRPSGLKLYSQDINGHEVFVIEIEEQDVPLVFTSAGEYEFADKSGKINKKTSWASGSLYFRHSAGSDPGSTSDLSRWWDRRLIKFKNDLLEGISKVVEAPANSVVHVLPREVVATNDQNAIKIVLTDAPGTNKYSLQNFDALYPYRAKELVKLLKERETGLNSHDVRLFREKFNVDDNVQLSGKSKYSTRQYSDALVDYIMSEYNKNERLFFDLRNNRQLDLVGTAQQGDAPEPATPAR